jgi:hypothetical protein
MHFGSTPYFKEFRWLRFFADETARFSFAPIQR